MTAQIENIDLVATSQQLMRLGQQHARFMTAHISTNCFISEGYYKQQIDGCIFLQDNTMIRSGFCATEAEMFSKLQMQIDELNGVVVRKIKAEPVQASVTHSQYATAKQKEQIMKLLNHPSITRQEKVKMIININRLDEENAIKVIAKLEKVIEDRKRRKKLLHKYLKNGVY